ncbi:MAG: hypothetical protein MJ249_17010, partial [Kiritimatiellae bacterium]|nr:hypothetical protein [Kiritimatiellia bacterium]
MNWKNVFSLLAAAICVLGAEAAQPHITTAVSYNGIWSVGPNFIYHIDPGGSVVVNKANGNCYMEILKTSAGSPAEVWLEGGTAQAEVLAFRGEYATYFQKSGTLTLTGGGFLIDGGNVVGSRTWLAGGTCNATVNFRNTVVAEFRMSGAKLIAPTFGGANMDKAKIYFDLTNTAYAVTGDYRTSNHYAIKATTPITQAPKSLTITGTPVSGCAYGLVDGITNDTFFTQTTVSVPAGWEFSRRGGKLLLIESAPLAVKTATWTG